MAEIYFDENALKRGKVFRCADHIRTSTGQLYQIGEYIDRGGNAVVYECFDGSGSPFALKILLNNNHRSRRRFLKETKLLSSFDHPHITTYYGSGKIEAMLNTKKIILPFIIMELATSNLQKLLTQNSFKVSQERYISQFKGLLSALTTLHERAIHRDIKPENILVAGDKWQLSDYGLCSFVADESREDLTPDNGVMGPKFWLSPEAHNKRLGVENEICEASDVYQIAAVFWYIIHGRHPSGILTSADWKGPEKLKDVLMNALMHDRGRRPQNGQAFSMQLETALMS